MQDLTIKSYNVNMTNKYKVNKSGAGLAELKQQVAARTPERE